MKLEFRNFPAIITLLAGFITCVITIICKYPLDKMLWVLILVMAVFYTVGIILRAILLKVFAAERERLQALEEEQKKQLEEQEETEEELETSGDEEKERFKK